MTIFDFFGHLCGARTWPLRAFSTVGASHSSFYPTLSSNQHDISSPISFTTTAKMPTPSSTTPMHSQTSTTKTKTTIPQMPLELILSFIETACAEGDHDSHVQLLRNCSLVSRSWSMASQKLLFSQVTLRSQRSFELFMNAVDRTTQQGRALGDAVKRVRVVLDHNQPSGLHQHSFALAVTVCPNLSHLELALYGCAEPGEDIVGAPDLSRLRRAAPSFDDQTLSLLKSGPSIEYLHFDNWSENQQSIFQLLDIWPSLQHLSIGGTAPQHLQDSPLPFPCALHGVRFNFQTLPSIDFMKWLLHNSTDTLRALRFDRDPCFDVLEYLANAHGSTLQSISLPAFGSPEVVSLITTAAANLRELRTESPSCPTTLYKQLPRHVEHLALGLDRDTPLHAVIEMIQSRDSLKTLDIQLWENGQHHQLLAPLKMACVYQGIELNMIDNLRLFRTMHSSPQSPW